MLKAAGLNDITVLREKGIDASRSDMWLVLENGIPIGAVEVKKPFSDQKKKQGIFEDRNFLGQIFDQLMCIRAFFGIRHVLGIVTTFEHWRFVCLPDSETAALSSDLSWPNMEFETTPPVRSLSVSSKIYSTENPIELCTALVSMLKKMHHAGTGDSRLPMDITLTERILIKMNSKGWVWQLYKFSQQLTLIPPGSKTQIFYLLRDYHGGADGKVWLAVSAKGNLAILKFPHSHGSMDTEVKAWRKCGFNTFSVTLDKRDCIVMPFLLHVKIYDGKPPSLIASISEWTAKIQTNIEDKPVDIEFLSQLLTEAKKSVSLKDRLLNAIEFLANNGICHHDIEWRHLAVAPIFEAKNLARFQDTLIDLTSCEFMAKEDAMKIMRLKYDELVETLPGRC